VLEGAREIAVSLFEAVEAVDAGPIYLQGRIEFTGYELVEDLRRAQAAATIDLCRSFVAGYPGVLADARAQTGDPTYYRRRTPADAKLDVDATLRSQFNLLRVSDNQRYPAWFEIDGRKYRVLIERLDDEGPSA
jgi:methionyl-tRNA formyltransferase